MTARPEADGIGSPSHLSEAQLPTQPGPVCVVILRDSHRSGSLRRIAKQGQRVSLDAWKLRKSERGMLLKGQWKSRSFGGGFLELDFLLPTAHSHCPFTYSPLAQIPKLLLGSEQSIRSGW